MGSIWRIPTLGGEETLIPDIDIRAGDWDLTGDGICYLATERLGGGQRWSIRFFSFATGEVITLHEENSPNFHRHLAVSPDGEWILYSEGVMQGGDIMLVENFR